MSLLSSLLEFNTTTQPSSLLFCQSPKEPASSILIDLTKASPKSGQKIPQRPSKSLTKLGLSTQGSKINPKDRILHRLAYKLQMKIRKHYYNFFVKLQNLPKNNPPSQPKKADLQIDHNIKSALQKLSQLQTILFSKYFEKQITKQTFLALKHFGSYKAGLQIMNSKFLKAKKEKAFAMIYNHSKKMEKECMRIEIFITSAEHIAQSYVYYHKKEWLLAALICIKQKSDKIKSNQQIGRTQVNCLKNTQKQQQTPLTPNTQPITESEIGSIYKNMKNKANSRNNSPCRPANKIGQTRQQSRIGLRSWTFLKAYSIKTSLKYQPFELIDTIQEKQYISKKCEPDLLNSREVNDIYDKNVLFFPMQIKQNPYSNYNISQSTVQSINFQDNGLSQVSIITPLTEVFEDTNRRSCAKSTKGNTFGLDAVSFKNSLISERDSSNTHATEKIGNIQEKIHPKSFTKQFKKVLDDLDQKNQYKAKIESRYESADKEYISSKIKLQPTTNYVASCLQKLSLHSHSFKNSNSQYHAAEPDFGKGIQSFRTTTGEQVAGGQKERTRRASYIKVTKKN